MLPSQRSGWRFGPFEVDSAAEELLRGEHRIRLSGQPFQILLMLLDHPGEVITREQLRERLWSNGTFVDFEHGLNAAINKLRRALGDSADNPRYIETIPGRGYRFIGVLIPEPHSAPPASPTPPLAFSPPRSYADTPPPSSSAALKLRPRMPWLRTAAIAVACGLSFLLGVRFHPAADPPQADPPWKLTRLSAPGGFSDSPALSRDGRLVAFSSDPGGKGQRDIYVRQVAGGQPIRLTTDGAGNTSPDFSPDGSHIVFCSGRDGGGIYITRAFGGEPRLLARNGRSPRFSPDGSLVAFWSGDPGVAEAVAGDGEVWIVPSAGGTPRRLAPNLSNSRYPVWAPDGRHLVAVGYDSNRTYETSALDWWLLPIDGAPAVRTGMAAALPAANLKQVDPTRPWMVSPNLPLPACWIAAPDRIVFSIQNGDSASLWTTTIAPRTGHITGHFQRLTAGAGSEVDPSCGSPDTFVFTDTSRLGHVWLSPADLNRGLLTGPLTQVTERPAFREHAELSRDGRLLAYASNEDGPLNIWLKNLETGAQTHVADSPYTQRYPAVSSSGIVAFSMVDASGRAVYIANPEGPQKICDPCFRATDWSADGKSFLTFGASPYEIGIVDLPTRNITTILKRPDSNLLYGRFSPDGRWVSFTMRTQPGRSLIMIAPLGGSLPIPETAWIKIADASDQDAANWSPDGKTLYFTSARDGHSCIWGQRLDPASHTPVGQAFPLLHLHGRPVHSTEGWSVAGSRIALVLDDGPRDVWMMSR